MSTKYNHNLDIFNKLVTIFSKNKYINIEKDINDLHKYSFNFIIFDDIYCISSFNYNNIIKIDLIGKDDKNYYRLLDVFENEDDLLFFFNNKYNLEKEYSQFIENSFLNPEYFRYATNNILNKNKII